MIKKKILIVGPAWPLRGGLATYNERLCREFNAQGHVCQILSFSLQYPSFLFPGKTQFSTDPKPNDIEILPQLNSMNPLNWLSVGNSMANRGYDVVIFRYWMSFMAPAFGTIARKIKNKSSAKILAITDNIIPHEKKFFDSVFTNYFLNSCDGFLSMSRAVYEQVSQLQPNKPRAYVPHPMYDMFGEKLLKTKAKEELELDINTNYLLFFGFIRKYKGLELLLKVMTYKSIRDLNIKLIIAGEFYELENETKSFIDENHLNENVVLHNHFIDSSKVKEYFCASDMVVQPYITATQSGITQIAYHFGTPMLVTNVGGLAEIVEHHKVGYVVDVDSEKIASAIVDFYSNNKEEVFRENVFKEAEKFSWQNLVDTILSF